jgi:hypothetical protein
MSRCAYQTFSIGTAANSRIASRYDRVARRTIWSRTVAENWFSRAATSKLAVKRLTSHSHGAGAVSSKSFMSKARRRSADPNVPKLVR